MKRKMIGIGAVAVIGTLLAVFTSAFVGLSLDQVSFIVDGGDEGGHEGGY